jgi:large subunit ribosomal protein L23Ae
LYIIGQKKVATKTVAKGAAAKKVAGALKKGSGRKATRVHTKVHFYKPKTLALARNPKVLNKSTPGKAKMDNYQILKFPLTTESAMKKIEDNNTLVFIVDVKANKRQIKKAVQDMHGVKAERVNTLIRPDGQKKAYVKLAADCEALDVANKMGVI